MTVGVPDVVPDPVSHISISGVHGQDEVDDRIAHAAPQLIRGSARELPIGPILLGAAVGAALMYLFTSDR